MGRREKYIRTFCINVKILREEFIRDLSKRSKDESRNSKERTTP